MPLTRRGLLAAGATALTIPAARAQAWPTRTLRLVVPFAPGGPTDFIGRILAERLRDVLGQSVVVENRAGAGGSIGLANVAGSPPDGYSIVLGTLGTHAITPLLIPGSGVDPAKDLVPCGMVGALPNVLVVNKSSEFKSLNSLLERARKQPDEISCGTFGPGSSPHVVTEMFQKSAGFKALHVPYTGSGTAITALIAGQIDFLFDSITTSVGHINGNAVRAFAVSSSKRSAVLPDVPTMKELGFPEVDYSLWLCIYAPAGTPPDILARIQEGVRRVSTDKDYVARLEERGAERFVVPANELQPFVAAETQRWRGFLQQVGIKPQQ
ncbi:Bug family tripartite tricarboxylate transporter substrate binding protein [Pseudoroseomonas ludipueritiae]|uniref:Tripartite tricarboxylate transporter substrate binding protein n=1 Tax=Pseudoroseomonas ludipueritiae TaxID=198093 RepID=A0ABR7RBR9_9PROT|nr:tripartite tricarboxylate transporter substrate binding protein [Pseudoroseomonas ludipueritiae]MBC9179284.1 tripartite tricarboxylate transporter substrate binding protein [Pseudoroseomonas ludipueritiae]